MRWLVLSPHPDDAEYGAGGLLVGLRELGMETHIACFVPSGELEDDAIPSEAASIRKEEARASAELLGATLHWLVGGLLSPAGLMLRSLVRLLREIRPDVVLTPDPADRHPFHVAVTGWLEQASQIATFQTGLTEGGPDPLGHPPQILYMETFTTTQFKPDLYVNVSGWYPTARQALLQHRTGLQICPGLEYKMRAAHIWHGAAAGVLFAEGFRLARGYAQDWVSARVPLLQAVVDLNRKAGA